MMCLFGFHLYNESVITGHKLNPVALGDSESADTLRPGICNNEIGCVRVRTGGEGSSVCITRITRHVSTLAFIVLRNANIVRRRHWRSRMFGLERDASAICGIVPKCAGRRRRASAAVHTFSMTCVESAPNSAIYAWPSAANRIAIIATDAPKRAASALKNVAKWRPGLCNSPIAVSLGMGLVPLPGGFKNAAKIGITRLPTQDLSNLC